VSNVKWDPEKILGGLGETFLITQCGYKAFPTEALTHQPITATLELMAEEKIDPHAVTEVLVKTTTRGADILSDPSKYRPTTKETADHSLPYCIAVAVAKGNVLPSDFEEEALKDPFVWELLPKIKVVADPEIDALFPKVKRAIVTIRTRDGESHTKQEDFAKGRAERPLTDEELIDKFRANASEAFDEAHLDKLISRTFELEKTEKIRDYMNLLIKAS
jgi:2-methylcitrate dehydratase